VKLFCGLLCGDPGLMQRARQLLTRQFGPVDRESDVWPFDQTHYYREQGGPDLKRWFLSFEKLVRPDALAEIKLRTNRLEQEIAQQTLTDVPRPVNLDPGYVDLSKLVLATTKDRSHRIYLGQGIHAEVTLQFVSGRWEPQPWTYADYRGPHYHAFFLGVRERLLEQRRQADELTCGEAGP
jgi:hypothetical protein